MEEKLSYVLVTPYTVAKSRTGGVISRLLSRLDLELIGAQMVAFDEGATKKYADSLRMQHNPNNPPGREAAGRLCGRQPRPFSGTAA